MVQDDNTARKIKESAEKLFTEKGYGRTTTREIASEAGVNLALVNYYFRSKEALFQNIMMETIQGFVGQLLILLNDHRSFEEKLELVVSNYIDLLIKKPDLPIFLLSELRNNPEVLAEKLGLHNMFKNASFFKELHQRAPEGMNPIHIFINMLSMTVFPFVARPLINITTGLPEAQFAHIVSERKKLIPMWVLSMLNPIKS
jgi:AcrR family transcriptional regulator